MPRESGRRDVTGKTNRPRAKDRGDEAKKLPTALDRRSVAHDGYDRDRMQEKEERGKPRQIPSTGMSPGCPYPYAGRSENAGTG